MAKAKSKDKDAGESTPSKKGTKVILPNGEARVDFIRRRYYDDEQTRSAIVKELKDMEHEVPYQIVFAATKTKEKPVPKPKASKADADWVSDASDPSSEEGETASPSH